MKHFHYQLIKLLFCLLFIQACQTKSPANSQDKMEWIHSCDTTYRSKLIIKNSPIEASKDKQQVHFSKTILSNIQLLRDSLSNIEELEIYGDSIMDVNGDGHLDLVLESYAGAGFGTKYLHSVYLFNPETKRYTNAFNSFLNVAFFPETKVFTSTYFGKAYTSGEKYKWEGMNFIKIETASMENYLSCTIEHIPEGKITTITNCSQCFPKEYLNYLQLH